MSGRKVTFEHASKVAKDMDEPAWVVRVRKGFCSYKSGDLAIARYDPRWPDDCVVEMPLSEEEIALNRERGSLITTICTTVGVPCDYVDIIEV